jgi:hypothetical protein
MDEQSLDQRKGGIYDKAFALDELAEQVNNAMGAGVEDEISAVRITIRRTLLKMEADLNPDEFTAYARTVFSGANTIANLLKTNRALSGKAADDILDAVAVIVQELAGENDWVIG